MRCWRSRAAVWTPCARVENWSAGSPARRRAFPSQIRFPAGWSDSTLTSAGRSPHSSMCRTWSSSTSPRPAASLRWSPVRWTWSFARRRRRSPATIRWTSVRSRSTMASASWSARTRGSAGWTISTARASAYSPGQRANETSQIRCACATSGSSRSRLPKPSRRLTDWLRDGAMSSLPMPASSPRSDLRRRIRRISRS